VSRMRRRPKGDAHDVGAVAHVVVAFDVRHRRDPFERADDRHLADVTGVHDGVGAAQRRERLGAQESMRVGDDAHYKRYAQIDAFFPHVVSP
jgi:hypothetical protein